MTDASSAESTTSNSSFAPAPNNVIPRYERLERPIRQLPAHLGLTNLRSALFQQAAAVLTLTSTYMHVKDMSALTTTCRRALLFKPSLKEAALITAQHLVDGNFLKADALFQKTRDQDKKALLDCVVAVTDHRNRKIKQRLFEITAMLGARRVNAQDIDLVESWGSYLPIGEGESRRKAVLGTEQERAAKRQPMIQAIRQFRQAIIQAQVPADGEEESHFEAFKIILTLAIEVYKNSFVPYPNEVITSGYVCDPQIFCDFIAMFQDHANPLGDWWSIKSDVFDIIGFGTLQLNASLWDFQVLRSGIQPIMQENKKPNRSFTVSSPDFQSLSGVGASTVLNTRGVATRWTGVGHAELISFYKTMCEQKHAPCVYAAQRQP